VFIPLPPAAAQPVGHIDLVANLELTALITRIKNEFDGDVVRKTAFVLLQHDQPLAKAALPERFGLFNQVDFAAHCGFAHFSFPLILPSSNVAKTALGGLFRSAALVAKIVGIATHTSKGPRLRFQVTVVR